MKLSINDVQPIFLKEKKNISKIYEQIAEYTILNFKEDTANIIENLERNETND